MQLKKDFEGIPLDAEHARYDQGDGDGDGSDIALTLGGNFAQDRGYAVLSLSWAEREDVDYLSRDFFRRNPGGTDFRSGYGSYEMGSNLPSQAALDAVFGHYGASARRRYRCRPPRIWASTTTAACMPPTKARTTSVATRPWSRHRQPAQLPQPVPAAAGAAAATHRLYDISDSVAAWGQFSWSSLHSHAAAEGGNTGLSVPVGNPFIPTDLRSILASRANPDANFTLHKRFLDVGPRTFERDFDSWQFLAGVKGPLPALNGNRDIYASKGQTRVREVNNGTVVSESLGRLINATDGGASLCAGGCNPFGAPPV